MKIVEFVVFCIAVSLASLGCCQQQAITVCTNVHGKCVNISNISEMIIMLKSTNGSEVVITFLSFDLQEVVRFENLSSTLRSISIFGTTSVTCVANDAGFLFRHLQINISLVDFAVKDCGFFYAFAKDVKRFRTALYFEECSDLIMMNVSVLDSRGSGVSLLNIWRSITILSSSFEGSCGGNGFILLLSGVRDSSIVFRDCNFLDNHVVINDQENVTQMEPSDVGGGLYVAVRQESSGNNVHLENCLFHNNTAIWGGGLNVLYSDSSILNNTVEITFTNFTENLATKGGGGIDIGYLAEDDLSHSSNTIAFRHSNFMNNHACQFGGGIAIFGTRVIMLQSFHEHILFDTCMWIGNTALSGAALDMTPILNRALGLGIFPLVKLINCEFLSNSITRKKSIVQEEIVVSTSGSGSVLIAGFVVIFQGRTLFRGNKGTALVVNSGTVQLLNGSHTEFMSNQGRFGGALSISGLSALVINDNSNLTFANNTAEIKGGAVFVDSKDYLFARNCFIVYGGSNSDPGKRNIQFVFKDNVAKDGWKNDVYASSTKACSCRGLSDTPSLTFECIGNVSHGLQLITDVNNFIINDTSSFFSLIVPGRDFMYDFPVKPMDEYNQKIDLVYDVTDDGENVLSFDMNSDYFSRGRVVFNGSTNVTGLFMLQTSSFTLSFNVSSQLVCPPGFKLQDTECVCAAENYFGLSSCSGSQVSLINGFWIGACPDNDTILCSSHCPLGFCNYEGKLSHVHIIPQNKSDLDRFICGPTRTGVICSSCRDNNSVYYHSYLYSCGNDRYCKFGILFYLISELVPLAVMFFVIIWLDINFTSGSINGFILFAQILDSVAIDANGVINYSPALNKITSIHRFIYRTFNFDFFSHESISFCLWKGATALDAMAMKYVTIFFAVIFLFLLVGSMNIWKCSRRAGNCLKHRTIQHTVIHGMTTFAAICYSQCARISFQIITYTALYGIDYHKEGSAVFRSGNFQYFRSMHLRYAIPAVCILLAMLLLPFFLIFYPLIFKLLSFCKLNESWIANAMSRCIPMQLLDAFQSAFKDNCRFFAGLYFFYRLLALMTYVFSQTLIIFYTFIVFEFVIVLMLHAAVQPYKNPWHNVIDSLVFANLAVISGISLFNYIAVINYKYFDSKSYDSILSAVQAFLIYLPLFCIVLYVVFIVFTKVRKYTRKDTSDDFDLLSSVNLPPLRDPLDRSLAPTLSTRFTTNYQKIKKVLD